MPRLGDLTHADVDAGRRRADARALDRHLAEQDEHRHPAARDCDEPDECTCPRSVRCCERVAEVVVERWAA